MEILFPNVSNLIFKQYYNLGMYSGFGGPSMYNNNNNALSNGIHNASQNAFMSAQAFIGAFSSVSMMLESTLFAVQNSVRAIAGKPDIIFIYFLLI